MVAPEIEVVVCDEHKNADPKKIVGKVIGSGKTGIESWDYLWQGEGKT